MTVWKNLTEGMIENCVEKIEIFANNRIEVRLRYQDQFAELENWIEKGGTAI